MPGPDGIACLDHTDYLLLSDAITDAIASEQELMRQLPRHAAAVLPPEAMHGPTWFYEEAKRRIAAYQRLQRILDSVPTCK